MNRGVSTTYEVTANGAYIFKANDSTGKEVTKTIIVDKIDKEKPTSPILSVTPENKINIILGVDSLSGIKEHQYKL